MQPTGFSRSTSLGQAAGEGIANLLGGLAQHKTQKMQQQAQQQQQQQLGQQYEQMGLPPGLAALEPQVQSAVIKQLGQQQKQQDLMSFLGRRGEGEGSPGGGQFSDEEILAIGQLDPNMARTLQSQKKQDFQERRFESNRLDKSFDFHKEALKETNESGNRARDNLLYVDEFQNLINEGNLTGPRAAQLFDAAGWNLDILGNPSSSEFGKIRTRFFNGMSKVFGGKVAVVEFQEFVKGLPSLTQTVAGQQLIANMMRVEAQGQLLRQEITNDVLQEYENAGKPLPKNLDAVINKRMDKIREPLVKEFHETQEKVRALGHASSKQKTVLKRATKNGGIPETPAGMVWMVTPNGTTKVVPEDEAMDAMRDSKYVFIQ